MQSYHSMLHMVMQVIMENNVVCIICEELLCQYV